LVVAVRGQIAPETLSEVDDQAKRVRTGFFDTHPSYSDRLASATEEDTPGIFHMDLPATCLFNDFPRLARAVSLEYYRHVTGQEVSADALIPVTSVLADSHTNTFAATIMEACATYDARKTAR